MREVVVRRGTLFRAPRARLTGIPSTTVTVGHQSTNVISLVMGPEIAPARVLAVPLAVAHRVLEIHGHDIAETCARRKAVSAPFIPAGFRHPSAIGACDVHTSTGGSLRADVGGVV